MALPSRAHVRINGVEYQLDENEDNHYVYQYRPLGPTTADPRLVGADDKRAFTQDSLYWTQDDWSGGEGNFIWYPDEPNKYWYSTGAHGRNKGLLQGGPEASSQTISTSYVDDPALLVAGAGQLWLLNGQSVWHASDPSGTWTSYSLTSLPVGIPSTALITAAVGDAECVYACGWGNLAGANYRYLFRINRGLASGTITDEAVVSGASGVETKQAAAGMAVLDGILYTWSGKKLDKYDTVTGTLPLTSTYITTVDSIGAEIGATVELGTTWWAGMVAADKSLIYFTTTEYGFSRAYQFKDDTPSTFWTPPQGFMIKNVTYNAGVVYFVGGWGSGSSALEPALWAVPLDTRRPYHILNPSNYAGTALAAHYKLDLVAPAYESSIILASSDLCNLYQYDPTRGSFSLIDNFTSSSETLTSIITFGQYRVALRNIPTDADGAGNLTVNWVKTDRIFDLATAGLLAGETLKSGMYDFGYPEDLKILLGFHVQFKPFTNSGKIGIGYTTDGGETYTSLTAITSATPGASTGRVFIPVSTTSSTVKFNRLGTYIGVYNTSPDTRPVVYSLTAEVKAASRLREWQLILKIGNEQNRSRPSNRSARSQLLRSNIKTAAELKNVVEFVDAYDQDPRRPGAGTTYSVTVEEVQDIIKRGGEGSMFVRLQEVPS